jgi:predicted RNase H-like nuclease (RuvC/YqgF family)
MGNLYTHLNSRNKVAPLESALCEIIRLKNGTIASQGATIASQGATILSQEREIASKKEVIARQKKEIQDVESRLRAAEARADRTYDWVKEAKDQISDIRALTDRMY